MASLVAQRLKCLPAMWETLVWSLGREGPLEKEMATHSSILAWRIPWMEELDGLQSTGSQRVGHDWATSLHFIVGLKCCVNFRHTAKWMLYTKSCPTLWNPWTVAYQVPLSMGFPTQEYWSDLLFPSPGDFLYSRTDWHLLHWQVDSLPLSHQGMYVHISTLFWDSISI